MRHKIRCEADPHSIRGALKRVRAVCAGRLGDCDAATLELALAEVLNNIVEHAYGWRGGPVALSVEIGQTVLYCSVADRGAAMPGLTLPPVAPPRKWSGERGDLGEGGWGWHILYSLTRDLSYTRSGTGNLLNFGIDLNDSSASDPGPSECNHQR